MNLHLCLLCFATFLLPICFCANKTDSDKIAFCSVDSNLFSEYRSGLISLFFRWRRSAPHCHCDVWAFVGTAWLWLRATAEAVNGWRAPLPPEGLYAPSKWNAPYSAGARRRVGGRVEEAAVCATRSFHQQWTLTSAGPLANARWWQPITRTCSRTQMEPTQVWAQIHTRASAERSVYGSRPLEWVCRFTPATEQAYHIEVVHTNTRVTETAQVFKRICYLVWIRVNGRKRSVSDTLMSHL